MRTMHLFAGAGGGLLADLILGHTPVAAVELDAYCCSVLRERAADGWWPNLHVHEGDVRLFDASEYAGRVDCIAAGFPCQDVSAAGGQIGVGVGTRSGLYREVLRIADQVRPQYLWLENVAAIVAAGLDTVLGDLSARGYDCRWMCLRASDVGAPHRRDRWWLLADAYGQGESQSQGIKPDQWGRTGDCGTAAPDTEWWAVEPDVGRVAHGVAARLHRLHALGNGQVPLQAAAAWIALGGGCG